MTKRDALSAVHLSDWLNNENGEQRKSATHAGLWLEKHFEISQEAWEKARRQERNPEKIARKAHQLSHSDWQRAVAELAEPIIYQRYFNDVWQPLWEVEETAGRALCHKVKTNGRLVTGLGDASVLEVGLTLHHTYGVPYLPGSGLKGLAAAYAHQRLGANDPQWKRVQKPGTRPVVSSIVSPNAPGDAKTSGEYYRTLFGDTDEAGAVDFEDALVKPKSWKLRPDVMTVHHQDYYNAGKAPKSAPADWDSTNPVPFLSVSGTFLIVLRGPQDWCAVAWEILQAALMREGAGGKTSSGYGRMKVEV